MSFVLQLGSVASAALEKTKSAMHQQSSSSLRSQELPEAAGDANDSPLGSDETDSSPRSQVVQCLESEVSEPAATHTLPLKSVSVTYPVAKAARDMQRLTATPQTINTPTTTQVLTTRVISQKLPASGYQQPITLNTSSHINALSSKQQSRIQEAKSAKLQPVSPQQVVKTITSASSMPNIQRIHVKAQNIVGQAQNVNLQKVKSVASVNNQALGSTVQRNSVTRIQTVPKSQVVGAASTQFGNQVANNGNAGHRNQGNATVLQKAQQAANSGSGAAVAQKAAAQIYNSQKAVSQLLGSHSNHKAQQQQQYPGSQGQQSLQKVQTHSQKGMPAVARQQQTSAGVVNNVQKLNNSVAGIQKSQQVLGQSQSSQQQSAHLLKHVQSPASHPRSQSAVAMPKVQNLASVNSSRVQTITNVCKSNSVPNISKMQQNSNVISVGKQQIISQSQQFHVQSSQQLQQQLLHQTSPPQQQSNQKGSTTNSTQPTQRSPGLTNMQKVSGLASVPNNQRGQLINSKGQQQQMVMRVGVQKNAAQTLQVNTKTSPTKVGNTLKTSNSPNSVQQQLHRNVNSQPVKIIQQQQQQQQNLGPQNTQKQPGCIKTIPAQKSTQRNHAQKVAGIKTSLNTNVAGLKSQAATSGQVTQKASIKTLLPQQTVAPNVLVHKSQPIKIQQQTIQQKQLIMTSQFPQQVRQQSGQIKTLLPVTATAEARKDVDNKNEQELKEEERSQSPAKSPVRRMPLPYECLQFVLQDHNYGAPPPRTPPPPSPPPHPKQQPINGASSSTTTVQHPYIYGPVVSNTNVEDDAASAISSEPGREAEPEGEETETAPEGEGDDEDSVTRCICDFEHDDGYMICCDRCLVWQHVDCMGIDRSNIPDEYLCEICRPRRVDRQRARALQMRKREELLNSDTSSETSSTSSADTDVGVNAVPKKRPLQQQVPRRKSEPPSQVRRLNNNNNNNNNVAKRQRRDSHPRQSSAVRKKEVVKRGPGKRKTKRRLSVDDKEEESQDSWGSNVAPLRQWIERYEEAVTNHYSPELRARISSIKVNGTHSDLRQSNMNVIATGKCRLNVHSNNLRFLVATMYLPPNTPVVELRGKYMLSTQHRPAHPQGRQHSQRPGPFVFFYRLPRDGTEVCVDTRTYGNDARFVRRSCKPNAEVKHCIEKGTLHLYIVTTTAIEKNAEITIRHDQHDLLLSPNPNCPISPVVCACNNPRECQITSVNQLSRRGSNGALAENADGRERRRRGRRNTVSEDSDAPTPVPTTSISQPAVVPPTVTAPPPAPVAAPPPPPPPPTPPRRVLPTPVATTTRQTPKEEAPAAPVAAQAEVTPPSLAQTVPAETKKDKKKMTREERKMEAIMKAFERLEKAEQRKQEVQARNAQRKESGGTHSDNEDSTPIPPKQQKQQNSERPLRRKRRKGRARTTSTSQSHTTRRTRLNSADSDVSSGDESNSMQSPPLHTQSHTQTRETYNSHLRTPAKNPNETPNSAPPGHPGIPTAAGLLLALANSNAPAPSSPPLQQPTPVKSPTCDSGASSSSQSSTPSTPLSSACLLVAAAVGPLAPGFKFPKTKKVLMNEWLKESPDPPAVTVPQVSPIPSLTPNPLQNSINPLCRSTDFSLPTDPSAEFLSQSYAAKSLATLVQAANSVSGICDSPPQRKQAAAAAAANSVCPVSTGSAKKRWLRQAISEECDSPNSRPESPPASEMVAPPKKRRIARESLSSDNYTPPTTPTLLVPEVVPNSRSLCHNEDDFEQQQSPLPEASEERQFDAESVKQEFNMDSEPLDSDETNSQPKPSDPIQPAFVMSAEKIDEVVHTCKTESPVKLENTMKEEVAMKELKPEPKSEDEDMEDCKEFVKSEEHYKSESEDVDMEEPINTAIKAEASIKEETIIERGTVEIVDQDDQDTEMEDASSPPAAMESDAILKQRVAEMRLEFGGSIAEEVNVSSENERSDDDRKCEEIKCHDARFDDNMSIDEFDVEAQMKKITGDDGNDYKEKVDSSSEKDKSMDGIEGLMESSKEDSESEDKEMDDYREASFKIFDEPPEERSFKEFESKPEVVETVEEAKEPDKSSSQESQKTEQPSRFVTTSEESVFESTSSNMDTESIVDPPKIFQSIPPLSERIRKKTDASTKSQLNFEAAIIESTINIEVNSMDESSKNGEEKSMLSTALRELLEAKLDEESVAEPKHEINSQSNSASPVESSKAPSTESSLDVPDAKQTPQETHSESTSPKEEEVQQKEVKRLKDPRTVVPNSMPAPAFKPDANPPVKRKLSISEYRKRKQQSSSTPPEPEQSNDASNTDKNSARGRSDSASSGTSSLSSDEEGTKVSLNLDIPSLTTLPLFANTENEEKKSGEEGAIGWSAAPTLVERQRENLTERLKREFGLFLSDDEEERARKHGLTAEAILKARKTSPPLVQVNSTPPGYPLPQLPPQPYIPPPGSAIHYPQFPGKSCPVQYPVFPLPGGQPTTPPVFVSAPLPLPVSPGGSKPPQQQQQQQQQFLVPQASPQAPPGSNPYPPQFIPPTNASLPAVVPKFSGVTTPVAVGQIFPGQPPPPAAPPQQKPFFTHPAPRS